MSDLELKNIENNESDDTNDSNVESVVVDKENKSIEIVFETKQNSNKNNNNSNKHKSNKDNQVKKIDDALANANKSVTKPAIIKTESKTNKQLVTIDFQNAKSERTYFKNYFVNLKLNWIDKEQDRAILKLVGDNGWTDLEIFYKDIYNKQIKDYFEKEIVKIEK